MPLLTRAESSGYTETSRHEDVLAFLNQLAHPHLKRLTFGKSPEGREMPLLILSTRGVQSPEDAKKAGVPTVLIINGIHAGEVEGKEASLMLVRDILEGKHAGLLDNITLLIVPLFNPDGNDRIDPKNRALDLKTLSGQLGPVSGVGTRTNASGINLNRDYMRQQALEMQLLQSRVCQPWAPDLTIDCHATNGSVHRFQLTYDVPHTVDSGRPEPIEFMRNRFLPTLTERVKKLHNRDTFFYGNFVEDEGGKGEGWMTYTHHPRFGSNYRGLTSRCDLLFETYAYISFEERVRTTYDLLLQTLRLAGERGSEILTAVEQARTPREEIAIRYALEAWKDPARILTRKPRTLEGEPIEVQIPHLSRFVGSRFVKRPPYYVVPPVVAKHLLCHGLRAREVDKAFETDAEVATIEDVRTAGGREILEAAGETLVTASFASRRVQVDKGSYLVSTNQPLGAIAVYLCEAESDDGLIASGLLNVPAKGEVFPCVRVLDPNAGL